VCISIPLWNASAEGVRGPGHRGRDSRSGCGLNLWPVYQIQVHKATLPLPDLSDAGPTVSR